VKPTLLFFKQFKIYNQGTGKPNVFARPQTLLHKEKQQKSVRAPLFFREERL
jgi:hypothetical protein